MNRFLVCAIICLNFRVVYATPASGRDSLSFGQTLQFGASTKGDSESLNGFKISTKVELADMLTQYSACVDMVGACCTWNLGAQRPFYVSKVPVQSIDFEKPLLIRDTTMFSYIDTLEDGNSKYYPSLGNLWGIDPKYSVQIPSLILIFRNKSNQYILVRNMQTLTKPNFDGVRLSTCDIGIKFEWQIQSTGSLLFPTQINEYHHNTKIQQRSSDVWRQINGRKYKKGAAKVFRIAE